MMSEMSRLQEMLNIKEEETKTITTAKNTQHTLLQTVQQQLQLQQGSTSTSHHITSTSHHITSTSTNRASHVGVIITDDSPNRKGPRVYVTHSQFGGCRVEPVQDILDRRLLGIELSPNYCDVARGRVQAFVDEKTKVKIESE
jgi:hypothetical protein